MPAYKLKPQFENSSLLYHILPSYIIMLTHMLYFILHSPALPCFLSSINPGLYCVPLTHMLYDMKYAITYYTYYVLCGGLLQLLNDTACVHEVHMHISVSWVQSGLRDSYIIYRSYWLYFNYLTILLVYL